jgi:hypothetical protein
MTALLRADLLGWWILPLLLVSALAFALLLVQERRAAEPMLPQTLWSDRTILTSNIGSLAIGATMMGITAFLPIYIQGIMGGSVFVAGVTIAVLPITWAAASTVAGRLILVTSYRTTALIGGFAMLLGSLVLLALDRGRGPVWPVAASALVGVGMGMCNTTFVVSVQNAVPWSFRGIATASTVFMRTLGSALGTAVLGAVLNLGLAQRLPELGSSVQTVVDPAKRAALPTSQIDYLSGAVAATLHQVYEASLILALAALAIAWLTPSGMGLDHAADGEPHPQTPNR